MVRVLFVCLGNICRSPMAEAVFMHKVREAHLDGQISADSAGTGNWHVGSAPHPGTSGLLRTEGINYEHAARALSPDDFTHFDIICTMDEDNFASVAASSKKLKTSSTATMRRFMEFAPDSGFPEVPDPYYDGNFQQTFDLVSAAAEGLLDFIRTEYRL